jgi:glycerate kinase
MKVVLAPDSFKGSLSAPRVAEAMADGLRRVWPDADCVLMPVADGGEGTSEALAQAGGGTLHATHVSGPLNEPTRARWAVLPPVGDENGDTLVIEMAEAAGLNKLPPERRNPLLATSRGAGELLLAALDASGATPARRKLVFALGGTATNDGGAGLLRALGVRLRDGAERDLPEGGAALANLATLDASGLRFDPARSPPRS